MELGNVRIAQKVLLHHPTGKARGCGCYLDGDGGKLRRLAALESDEIVYYQCDNGTLIDHTVPSEG